jgi:hypothetical protein
MHVLHTLSHPSRRSKTLLRALALASLAVAGFVLPFVWDVLAAINELPKMAWLQALLAHAPLASWLMMFVWGAAVPAALLLCMQISPTHRLRNAAMVLALMLVALTWYVHMPASSRCVAVYPGATWACDLLQWGYSLSLGIATATYVFAMLAMGFSALGLLAESFEEAPA